MSLRVYRGGRWRTISGLKAYANGAWRTILTLKVYKSGAWRTVANFTAPTGTGGGGDGGTVTSPMSLTISPSSPFVAANRFGGEATRLLTATPAGGKSPYSYAWTFTYNSGGVTFSTTSSASTTVSGEDSAECTVKCVCTDSLGSTASATVTGTFIAFDSHSTV